MVASIGPAASQYWAQPPHPGPVHPHGSALCGFCLEAALHCTCEHIYAGLIRQGKLEVHGAVPPQRQKSRQAPQRPSDASPGVLLAALTPQQDRARASTSPSAVGAADPRLAKVLKALNAADAIPAFTKEGFDMESLAAWSFPDLRLVFGGTIIAASTLMMVLRCAQDPEVALLRRCCCM